MEAIVIYVSVAAVLAIVVTFVVLLKRTISRDQPQAADRPADVALNAAGVLRPQRVGAVRRRRLHRLQPAHSQHDPDDSDNDVSDAEDENEMNFLYDRKTGTKKMRKLEQKAERKAQRQAEEEERKERREREEKLEHKRKKEEEQKSKEEAAKAADEQRLKEEQAQREHAEYLKMKEAFTVDEEGIDAHDDQDVQSLLQEFIIYIEQNKVIMLEDLASQFKIKTQDAIDRVKTLQSDGRLSGVIDDRGKFICITASEYESVARFIRQRGRVSISELADSVNRLIRLNADGLSNTVLTF